jgi:hypothetical protein
LNIDIVKDPLLLFRIEWGRAVEVSGTILVALELCSVSRSRSCFFFRRLECYAILYYTTVFLVQLEEESFTGGW